MSAIAADNGADQSTQKQITATDVRFCSGVTSSSRAAMSLNRCVPSSPEFGVREYQRWTIAQKLRAEIALCFCSSVTSKYLALPSSVPTHHYYSVLPLPGGKAIALIGKSGCGKSTLAKLIASLYQPQSGNIRIGLYNLPDLSLDCLRQQVAFVPQEPHPSGWSLIIPCWGASWRPF